MNLVVNASPAIVAMGGLDAVAFTGGIGEHADPMRTRIMDHLKLFGDVPTHVVEADEDRQIATDALKLIQGDT